MIVKMDGVKYWTSEANIIKAKDGDVVMLPGTTTVVTVGGNEPPRETQIKPGITMNGVPACDCDVCKYWRKHGTMPKEFKTTKLILPPLRIEHDYSTCTCGGYDSPLCVECEIYLNKVYGYSGLNRNYRF